MEEKNGAALVPSVKTILISDHLSEASVLFFPEQAPKDEILFKLVSSLPIADHAPALNAVLEREKMGSTIIDFTISIPHARLKGLQTIQLALGIRDSAPKDEPRFFFLFLSPKEDTKNHLLFLSSLSSLFQNESFGSGLSALKTSHQVIQLIRETEKGI